MSLRRRDLLLLAAAMPAAACLASAAAAVAAGRAPPRRLFVYGPGVPACVWQPLAVRQGLALRHLPVQALALEGDRVRFARACLAGAPDLIGGVLPAADFLVLSGTAEEAGLRLREERLLRSPGQPGHVVFSMRRRGTA
jgi:hypothetical protein